MRATPRDAYISSLPIYPERTFYVNGEMRGIHLLDAYSIEAHCRGTVPTPSYYVPPQSWWALQADSVIKQALQDGDMLFHRHPCPFGKIRALVDQFWWGSTSTSHGHTVPSELPGALGGRTAKAILYSALAMALASFGITQPIPFARHVLGLVAACCRKVAHDNDQSLFAKAALVLGDDAWDYVSDRLSLHIQEI